MTTHEPRERSAVNGRREQYYLEPRVFDAELIDEDASTNASGKSPFTRLATFLREWWTGSTMTRVRSVAGYRLRKLPLDIVRLLWFVIRGHGRWIRKAWTWFTYGDLRADARSARLAGDAEARRTAQETLRADSKARWGRAAIVLSRCAIGAAALVPVALSLWAVDSLLDRRDMWPWLVNVYEVLDVTWSVLVGFTSVLLVVGPVGWLVAAAWEGRSHEPGAGWLTRADRDDADSWIDERMVSKALGHLGIGPLNAFFKNGGELVYSVPARRDGNGTYTQVRLPLGATADMVADRRDKLAANLGRAKLETWPTEGDEAGVLDLWVSDKGALAGGAGEWPLQHDGHVDVFEGVPFGLTQRGIVVNAPLLEANWLIGGRPGQGKSAALRTLLLGTALDPTAELWIFVMGESPDFDPFDARAARYRMGIDDAVAESAIEALEDLLQEMERRGKVLGEQPGRPPKVSRKLADKRNLGLHPLVCAIDECHELFQHPTYGKRAAELAIRLIKRGRKYGIVLLLATQSPTKDSIPREVTRNVSCGVAFSVADQIANDGLLGSGKYRAGIRATDLRMKTDRGTCVAVGVTDENFDLIRTFYIPFEDEVDMVTPVITRALGIVDETGRTIDATRRAALERAAADHLADIAAALQGERRVPTRVVLTRLVEQDPVEYEGWTFSGLKSALAEHDITPRKSGGVHVIRAEDVDTALAQRGEE